MDSSNEEKASAAPSAEIETHSTLDAAVSGILFDAEIAKRVMGWHVEQVQGPTDYAPWINWVDAEGVGRQEVATWSPSTDIAAAMEVENRIAELGSLSKIAYLDALRELVEADRDASLWSFVHANAEQRCRAALAAVSTHDPSGEGKTQ